MKFKQGIPAVSLLALVSVFAALPASADPVVYDNTGSGSYTTNAWSIYGAGGIDTVTNSFTLSKAETIEAANFAVWVLPGDSLTSVTWAITDTAFGTSIAGGTAVGGPNTQVAAAFGYYPVLAESVSIPYVTLAAGSYWFQLSDGQDAYDSNVWWDESDGSSTALATDGGVGSIPSETFQLVATPEPSSFVLLGSGILALAGRVTRRRLLP